MGLRTAALAAGLLAPQVATGQSWESVGPRGSFIVRIEAHPTNPDILYAGGDDCAGVFRTLDGGTSWRRVTGKLSCASGYDVEIDPVDPRIIYATDGYGRHPIIRSQDMGGTWEDRASGIPARAEVWGISVDPTNHRRVFAATGKDQTNGTGWGVYRSDDGGDSWQSSAPCGTPPTGLCGKFVHSVLAASNGYVYAGTGDGIYRSRDAGVTWTLERAVAAQVVSIVESSYGHIWASSTGDPTANVWLSIDGGETFHARGLPDELIHEVLPVPGSNVVYATSAGAGLRVSTDGGRNWSWDTSWPAESLFGLGLGRSADGTLFLGTYSNEGIYRKKPGGPWENVITGMNGYYAAAFAVAPSNSRVLYVADNAGYADSVYGDGRFGFARRSARGVVDATTGAIGWTFLTGIEGTTLSLAVHPQQANTILVGTFQRGLYRSTDGGKTAKVTLPGWSVTAVAFDPDNPAVVVAGAVHYGEDLEGTAVCEACSIGRSVDGGENWTWKSTTWQTADFVLEPGTRRMFAATTEGVKMSLDDGLTWGARGLPDKDVATLAQDGVYEWVVYAGTRNGELHRSVDWGATWEKLTLPPLAKGAEIRHLATDPNVPLSLFVGANGAEMKEPTGFVIHVRSGGLWHSGDGGATFSSLVTSPLPNDMVFGGIAIDPSTGRLYVGLYGAGLYRLDLY